MNWPELVQAIGVAGAAVIGAWTALNAKQIKDLQARVDSLEASNANLTRKLRVAVNHIREWMTWWRTNHPGTTPPGLPAELKDEV